MANMMTGGINFGNGSQQGGIVYGQPVYDQNLGYVNRTNTVGAGNSNFGNMQQLNTISYPMIIGKYVDSEQDIAPMEVPNDGKNVGIFVQRDAQRIYMKQVGGDGLIHGNTYILEQPKKQEEQGPTINDILSDISNRLDGIEKSIAKQRKPYNPNYKRNNYKPSQEGKNNE